VLAHAEGSEAMPEVVVVARLAADVPRDGLQHLKGVVGPLEPALLDSIFSAETPDASARIEGLLLDTLAATTREQAWTRIALVLAAIFGALWLYRSALREGAGSPAGPAGSPSM
jgi:hypothetical protein